MRSVARCAAVSVAVLAFAGCAAMRSFATGLPPEVHVTTAPGFVPANAQHVAVIPLMTETMTNVERDALGQRLAGTVEAVLTDHGYAVRAGGLGRTFAIGAEAAAIDEARSMGLDHLAVVTLTQLAEGYDLDPASGRRAYRVRYAASVKLVAVESATPVWSASASGDANVDGEGASPHVAAEVVEAIVKELPRR